MTAIASPRPHHRDKPPRGGFAEATHGSILGLASALRAEKSPGYRKNRVAVDVGLAYV